MNRVLRNLASAANRRVSVCLVAAFAAFAATAETISWTGGAGDGLWATKGNWDLGRVPVPASDDIVLPASDTPYAVTNTSASTYSASVTVGNGATLRIYHNHSTTRFGNGCTVDIRNGGTIDTWQPSNGGQFYFDLGSTLLMEGGAVFTNPTTQRRTRHLISSSPIRFRTTRSSIQSATRVHGRRPCRS